MKKNTESNKNEHTISYNHETYSIHTHPDQQRNTGANRRKNKQKPHNINTKHTTKVDKTEMSRKDIRHSQHHTHTGTHKHKGNKELS